ncbi:MAG: hypothetical protein K1X75_06650 [Leptospirales bacterium]|nr:hypothetical protein [Leptospirales bacterium]
MQENQGQATDLQEALSSLGRFLEEVDANIWQRMSDVAYAWTQLPAFPSTVGAHLRHLLDHIEALLDGLSEGRVQYDRRQRGRPEESQRDAGHERLRRLLVHLDGNASLQNDRDLLIEMYVDPDQAPIWIPSTLLREIAFVHHHGVHHAAMIAVQMRAFGLSPTPELGVAPATLAYYRQ